MQCVASDCQLITGRTRCAWKSRRGAILRKRIAATLQFSAEAWLFPASVVQQHLYSNRGWEYKKYTDRCSFQDSFAGFPIQLDSYLLDKEYATRTLSAPAPCMPRRHIAAMETTASTYHQQDAEWNNEICHPSILYSSLHVGIDRGTRLADRKL
jgi:hypothetical protein